jgi:colanic acid/amylovoran biosynthesis glycosyltransferase
MSAGYENPPMHVAYIVNTYPRPSHSFIRREIRALERRGLTVSRFAMRGDRAVLADQEDLEEFAQTEQVLAQGAFKLGLSLIRAIARPGFLRALRLALTCGWLGRGGVPGTGGVVRHIIYLAEAAHVARRCKALGVQHLHAHFGTNAAAVAMLAHPLSGLPYSFTVHGPEEFDAPRALALHEKIHHAAFCVAISQFGRSQLMRWSDFADWPRLKVVHCGIEPERFATPAALPPKGRRLVTIGRFSEQKGHLLLVEAFSQAVRTAPDLHLTFVGDGELRPALERAIRQHGLEGAITLAGWLDEQGVRRALADAHALVLPSFAEGLPMVVMEAMAAARPVLATSIAGVPELVVHRETGWLVPAGDPKALADAMGSFAGTPLETLAEMGDRGRQRVMDRHDVNRSAEILMTCLEGFVSKDIFAP